MVKTLSRNIQITNRLQRYGKKLKNTNKIVKNLKTYSIIALMLGIGTLANAQVKNYFGLWLEGGEWSLMTSNENYKNSVGAAGAAGVLYDLQAGHFILDLGVGARYGLSSFNYVSQEGSELRLANQINKDGAPFTYVYNLKDRKDQYTNLTLQIPLMLGGQWGRFYMLGGVKAGVSLLTQARTKAVLNTYGEYTEMASLHTNMPEYQFYQDKPINQSYKINNFNFNLDASAEIGVRLGFMTNKTGWDVPKTRTQYRLALFADYGVLDLHNNGNSATDMASTGKYNRNLGYDPENEATSPMLKGLELHDVMSVKDFSKAVNNLMVGVKLTVLFELPEPKNCVICKEVYSAPARVSKGRGKIAKE